MMKPQSKVILFGIVAGLFFQVNAQDCSGDPSFCDGLETWCSDPGVQQWCPDTCGQCSTTTTTTTTTTTPAAAPCVDNDNMCSTWISHCADNTWMKTNCMKTCALCGSGAWSQCTKSCGSGTRHREQCDPNGDCETIFKPCNTHQCPQETCTIPLQRRYGLEHTCCEGESMTKKNRCGQTFVQAKVIESVNAKTKQWPWMVSIRMTGGQFCGGIIISKKYVLSAAHCFADLSGKLKSRVGWKFHAGLLRLNEASKAEELTVKKVFVHPQYKFPANDIAIIELTKSLKYKNIIQPLCLPGGEVTPLDTTCFVTGWGMSDHSGFGTTNHLQEAPLHNLDRRICRDAYAGDQSVSDFLNSDKGYLCAGSLTRRTDSCGGDSGGPLACQRCSSCTWYLAGIVSFGSLECGTPGIPGVYTEVRAYESWISQVTGIQHPGRSCARQFGP